MDEDLPLNEKKNKPVISFANYMGSNNHFLEEYYMAKVLSTINKKKDEILKKNLEEKGFGNLIPYLYMARFPRVCCKKFQNWSYYFADDGTVNGKFIVAIEDYDVRSEIKKYGAIRTPIALNCKFNYDGELDLKPSL